VPRFQLLGQTADRNLPVRFSVKIARWLHSATISTGIRRQPRAIARAVPHHPTIARISGQTITKADCNQLLARPLEGIRLASEFKRHSGHCFQAPIMFEFEMEGLEHNAD